MRKEYITIYDAKTNENIDKLLTVYRTKELIDYINTSNINVNEYLFNIHTPHHCKCSINLLKAFEDEEFFIDHEEKIITLYIGIWVDRYKY